MAGTKRDTSYTKHNVWHVSRTKHDEEDLPHKWLCFFKHRMRPTPEGRRKELWTFILANGPVYRDGYAPGVWRVRETFTSGERTRTMTMGYLRCVNGSMDVDLPPRVEKTYYLPAHLQAHPHLPLACRKILPTYVLADWLEEEWPQAPQEFLAACRGWVLSGEK